MGRVHYIGDDISVVGWSCRLPGAPSVDALWSLLMEGRCSVTSVPPDRFSLDRFGHPRRQERGRSYSWAAGILEDIWQFDPTVFGISPREAVQMDPQQRLLLQLTWEALEDAGIPPSSLAGGNVGVYVGASQIDYAHAFLVDQAIGDSHFATGTALAILANRISYIFDLHGPSVTVDTACSSSLVALHYAVEAIRSGRIDTAIVAGVNVITSPASFIAFSQAAMLSPTGLCQAFSDKADGFVRAEGGGVVVLRRASHAQVARNPVHGIIVATDVNSDGRTSGISLPSLAAQQQLLERIYAQGGIDPNRLAFVEAHGTGTPAGDPIEAAALGRGLGVHRDRSNPLLIGSVKTNIGHLEPGAGIAGLIKALLALNHRRLPSSLHFGRPNPNIPFDELNLAVCREAIPLPETVRLAGVNSFGFGGTNAHAVVAAGRPAPEPSKRLKAKPGLFMLSAETAPALTALAETYARRVEPLSERDTAMMAAAVAHRRERMTHRLVVSAAEGKAVARALDAFAAGGDAQGLVSGQIVGTRLPVAMVFSGNGGQWAGMGVAAYRHNAAFRAHFNKVDACFRPLAGWSLRVMLLSDDLAEKLPLTSVAQPLMFAVQSAAAAVLRGRGIQPVAVLGHSVGEIAAAEAAGVLDLPTATRLVFIRSKQQERVRGLGRMMALRATAETVADMLQGTSGVEIAAFNSPRGVTLAGPADQLAALMTANPGVAMVDLDLDYPFHTELLRPIRAGLIAELGEIEPKHGDVAFISTVTGEPEPGDRLDASYWWRNVRAPVQLTRGLRAAAAMGARLFLEIGARPTLLKHITDSLDGEVTGFAAQATLDRKDNGGDPFDAIIANAVVAGADIDIEAAFGADPGPAIRLPTYAWQTKEFRFQHSVEAVASESQQHPFVGLRYSPDALEWHAHIDTVLHPALLDHRLGEQVIFPGTAFLEIALAVAREWLKTEHVTISNFEIMKALDLTKGETREVMTRVSPGSNTIEIFSRPRLSPAAWLLHCRGKMQHGNRAYDGAVPEFGRQIRTIEHDEIYRIAADAGLHYGPRFRLAQALRIDDRDRIDIALAPGEAVDVFVQDPIRTDCCAHGIFAVFEELKTRERAVAYIPVRLDQVSNYRPHVPPARAILEIVSRNSRAIVANCFLFDRDGAVIAVLRGVRCQAVPVRHVADIDSVAVVEVARRLDGAILGITGMDVSGAEFAETASAVCKRDGQAEPRGADLLEGWAISAAYEIATALAEGDAVDPVQLVTGSRIPPEMQGWLTSILVHLEGAGLARERVGAWTLVPEELPASSSLIKDIAERQPQRGSALLLAGALTSLIRNIQRDKAIKVAPPPALLSAAADFHEAAGAFLSAGSDVLLETIMTLPCFWPANRALRILQLGYGALTHALAQAAAPGAMQLTVLEPDRLAFDRATSAMSRELAIKLLSSDDVGRLDTYDIVISVGGLHRLPEGLDAGRLARTLAPRGLLVALESAPSLFCDLVFGIDPAWFVDGDPPRGRLRSPAAWRAALQGTGFDNIKTTEVACGGDTATLIVAGRPGEPAAVPATAELRPVIVSPALSVLAAQLQIAFEAQGIASQVVDPRQVAEAGAGPFVVFAEAVKSPEDPQQALTRRCLALKAFADALAGRKATAWLIFTGAAGVGEAAVQPVESGAWAFSRTLANEVPTLDVRRVSVACGAPPSAVARHIAAMMRSQTQETEFHLDGETVRAIRVRPIKPVVERLGRGAAAAARLQRRIAAGQRVRWEAVNRTRPAADEVEIAVEATGLNFRDLMWTLSLLPDDMLEDGFTGPALGLECAGRVLRVGSAVKDIAPGDRVMALAASAFATHVSVPAARVARIPDGMSFEGAATIPVAFLTAYYSLMHLARLCNGETVLIHGGAGAVGMAAIQIAKWRGARVIATAGSPAKRSLIAALGADVVLDSRSTAFAAEVAAATGGGVDVVLNSLAGEAMELSIGCLRPFGRFVELGKRDYVTNTHIGLRPFRKNLSYFGVDLDQLVVGREAAGEALFKEVMQLFDSGAFTQLPHSVFAGANIAEALHLMQQSSHVGKIVVRPIKPAFASAPIAAWTAKPGTHLITGAFGGFGAEVAQWLVERGARHLVLVGRRGADTAEAKALVERLVRRGVTVIAERCDIADARAVETLFRKLDRTMPPVVGIMHAAMVLDDATMANLSAERFDRVLAPKVRGAENLDLATRGMALDYFVLFSSVTTLIGNPGQGNYVAANAFMEGLARQRRQKGLPALAVGWGPISDVGVVAASDKLRSALQKLSGVKGMRARDALELLGQALALPGKAVEIAAMTISPNDGNFNKDRLPVLRSPTYASFVRSEDAAEIVADRIDIRALLQQESAEVARRQVADIVVRHLAKVLHARPEDISRVRPLGEIGLDSLMTLELVMDLEQALGFNISLVNAVGTLSIPALADEIIAQVDLGKDREETLIEDIAGRHVTALQSETVERLRDVTALEVRQVGERSS